MTPVLSQRHAEPSNRRCHSRRRASEYGHWGILVVDRKTGQTIYERDADQLFAPASVTKLFSTAAALVELGPSHRFQTPLVRRGESTQGTLHGDVILIAQGDLAMGGRTGPEGTLLFKDDDHTYAAGNLNSQVVPTDPLAGLDHIAREVQAAGIREITGDVIVDDRLFSPAQATGSGPQCGEPDRDQRQRDRRVGPAGSQGGRAGPGHVSAGDSIRDDGCASGDGRGRRSPASRFTRSARGGLPFAASCRWAIARVVKIYEVDEPASFARALLIEALRRRGVRVASSNLDVNETIGLPSQREVAKLPGWRNTRRRHSASIFV